MFYFLMQLAAVLAGAIALGLFVGWMLWARALRHHRRTHGEQVSVLHRQLASLADENRRAQQRFSTAASELDGQRLAVQARDAEIGRAREAFTVSQQNLASAETQLDAARAELSEATHRSQGLAHDLATTHAAFAALQSEAVGLRLDSAAAQELRGRVDALVGQVSTLTERAEASQAQVARLQGELDAAHTNVAATSMRAVYLGRALDAATARANDRTESTALHHSALQRLAATHADELNKVGAQHAARSHTDVESARMGSRADVNALTATWAQINQRHATERADAARELASLRSQLSDAERNLADVRAQSAAQLEAVQRSTHERVGREGDEREASLRAELIRHHDDATSTLESRHARILAQQVDAHQLAVSHWRDDLARRAAQRDADVAAIAQLQSELDGTQHRLGVLHADFDRVALERHLLDESLTKSAAERDAALQALDAAHADLASADALRAELATIRQERDELRVGRDAVTAQHENLQLDRDAARAEVGSLTTELATTQDRLRATIGELGVARQSLAETISSVAMLRAQVDTLTAERALLIDRQQAGQAVHEAEQARVSHERDALAERLAVVQASLDEQTNLVGRHEAAVVALRSTVDAAKSDSDRAAQDWSAERRSLEANHHRLNAHINELAEDRRTLARQFDDAVLALGNARRDQLASVHQEAATTSSLRREVRALTARLELAEAEAHRRHVQAIEQAREHDLHQSVMSIALADANRRSDDVRSQLDSLQAEYSSLQSEHSSLQSEYASMQSEHQVLPPARRLRVDGAVGGDPGANTSVSALSSSADPSGLVDLTAAADTTNRLQTVADLDDLERIEGIGPKIASALRDAGIGSFVRLEAASVDQLRDALASSGLTFAPSLVTWSRQAGYLVAHDEPGLAAYQAELTAGRESR